MRLSKLNLKEVADHLDKPFSMVDMAVVGDLTVSLYLCQGVLAWHKHLDQDELFWVHQGTILLESERGEVQLRAGELAVIPKGLSHRSGSPIRSTVILIRCTIAPDRKNGRRRLYGTQEPGPRRISLTAAAGQLAEPFRPQTVARVEDAQVQVMQGEGGFFLPEVAAHDILLVVLSGTVVLETEESVLALRPDDLTVIPRGIPYSLNADGAVLVRVTREELA